MQARGELKKGRFSSVINIEFNGFKQGGINLEYFINPTLVKAQLTISLK